MEAAWTMPSNDFKWLREAQLPNCKVRAHRRESNAAQLNTSSCKVRDLMDGCACCLAAQSQCQTKEPEQLRELHTCQAAKCRESSQRSNTCQSLEVESNEGGYNQHMQIYHQLLPTSCNFFNCVLSASCCSDNCSDISDGEPLFDASCMERAFNVCASLFLASGLEQSGQVDCRVCRMMDGILHMDDCGAPNFWCR